MEYINDLHELCETIMQEVGEANDKIREAGGKLTAGDLEYLDKVTHCLKSIKGTIMMMENEGGSYDGGSYDGGSYDGGSYDRYRRSRDMRGDNGSYGRGRSRYSSRDGMGRSTRRYSRDDGMVEKLRQLMNDAPNEQIQRDIQRLIQKLEQED